MRMMQQKRGWLAVPLLIGAVFVWMWTDAPAQQGAEVPNLRSTASPKASLEQKKARWAYWHRMLRDPATGEIPQRARARELAFAEQLSAQAGLAKGQLVKDYQWAEAGPINVGGRTRALAVDVTDSDVILAAGVSGGVWKSTNGGASWRLTSDAARSLSVTSLAQDPRPGNTDTWYYVSGEFTGNSTFDQGFTAPLMGFGLFRSTDNGETWSLLLTDNDDKTFSSQFDLMSRVIVSPTTGTVYFASHAFGIFRMPAGTSSPTLVVGGVAASNWADVAVAPNGDLLASISVPTQGGTSNLPPGIYRSTNDGVTWSDVTPTGMATNHNRSVVAFAPSNTNVGYAFVHDANADAPQFFKLNLNNGTSENRTANLPDFGDEEEAGFFNLQGAYNMALAVKPDDENFVLLGATNLYRSRDGFATPATNINDVWIGGYDNSNDGFGLYPNSHPDMHVFTFDPANPNRLLTGHDGGISSINDIRSSSNPVPWVSENNGYNVTQYYKIAISTEAGDDRIVGGTQDNSSPFMRFTDEAVESVDIFGGDGATAHIASNNIYVSAQNGLVGRFTTLGNGEPNENSLSFVQPSGASNQQFIHPYVVDPVSENVMFYPDGRQLWRSVTVNTVVNFNQNGTSTGWTQVTGLAAPSGFDVTALNYAQSNPSNRLYYGASGGGTPRVFRLDNASTATSGQVEVSPSGAAAGAYVSDIAVNPEDGDEIIVVLSNYEIEGLFHSSDGGDTYTAIEGNLGDTGVTASDFGPSMRGAVIVPFSDETVYMVATSIGVFSTTQLNGASTVWTQEGAAQMGNIVVEDIAARTSDKRVVAASHGRGVFVGNETGAVSVEGTEEVPGTFQLTQNYPNPFNPTTTILFSLPEASAVRLRLFDLTGRELRTLVANVTYGEGTHTVQFDAGALASGTYLYRLEAQPLQGAGRGFTATRQMTYLK